MRYQIRIRENGAYEVVDVQTGEVRFIGSHANAISMQLILMRDEHIRRTRPR